MASPHFVTSFEGAAEGPNVRALNIPGVFTFEPPNATRITNADPAIDPQGDAKPLGMGVTSIDGQKFLRFRYQPSTTPNNPWSEQRWYVDPTGGPYVNAKREMWAQWWVFLPTNWHNRQDDAGSRHKKFAAFWNTSYSVDASRTVVVFELWPEVDPATGTSTRRSFLRASTDSYASSSVQQRATYSNAVNNDGTGAIELGKWQRIRVHLKRSSAASALDGVVQMWVGDTLAINRTDLSLWSFNDTTTTHDYWRAGYLMGEATRGFDPALSNGVDIRTGVDAFSVTFADPVWRSTPSPTTHTSRAPESTGVLLASFKASEDFVTRSPTRGLNFGAVKNGVRLFNNATAQMWPVAHPIAPGVSYEGGSHVFRIRFASKAAGEIQFSGLPDVEDLHIEQHVYMPSGAEHTYVGDLLTAMEDGGSSNDKLFRVYGAYQKASKDYSVLYGASTWPIAPKGPAYIGTEFVQTMTVAPYTSNAMGEQGSSKNRQPSGGFVGAAAYAGAWTRLRFRCKVATAANNDGIIQIWVNDTLVLSRTNLPTYAGLFGPGVHNAFRSGYLWGWQNNAVRPNGRLYIDNIRFSSGGFA